MNDGAADHRRMGYRERIAGIALLIQPTAHATNQIHDGFASMGSGTRVCQPRGYTVRIVRLELGEIDASPLPVIAVAKLKRDDSREAKSLGCLLRPALRG